MRADAYLGGKTLARSGTTDRAHVRRPVEGFEPLSDVERADLLRAALGYALAATRSVSAGSARNSAPKWRRARSGAHSKSATAPFPRHCGVPRPGPADCSRSILLKASCAIMRARYPGRTARSALPRDPIQALPPRPASRKQRRPAGAADLTAARPRANNSGSTASALRDQRPASISFTACRQQFDHVRRIW